MAWAPVVHAVATAELGPLAPRRTETWPAARFTIDDEDEKRRHPFGALLEQHPVLALDDLEAADAAADHHAHARRVVGADDQAAGRHRHVGGRDGELDEAPALLDVLAVDPSQRVEGLDLAGKSRGVSCCVKQRDGRDPGAAGEDALPRLLGADAERRYKSDAGHDHAPKAG